MRELEERVMDLKAQAAAVQASGLEAESTLSRTKALASSGYQTAVAVERAERDAKSQPKTRARSITGSLPVWSSSKLHAAVNMWATLQMTARVRCNKPTSYRFLRCRGRIGSCLARPATYALIAALSAEASRYAELSNAVLSSPTNTLVWQILVAPGEDVRKGTGSAASSRLLCGFGNCYGPGVGFQSTSSGRQGTVPLLRAIGKIQWNDHPPVGQPGAFG